MRQNSTSKYHSNKTTIDGITFDSKKEAKRYKELLLLEKEGYIEHLRRQVPFTIVPKSKTERAVKYVADFIYDDVETGAFIVEDVKSSFTRKNPTYIIKRKLMKLLLEKEYPRGIFKEYE